MVTLKQLVSRRHTRPLFLSAVLRANERLSCGLERPPPPVSEAPRQGPYIGSTGALPFCQRIQRMGERPRAGAIAIAGERLAQGVYLTAVLQQQGCSYRRIPCVHVNGRSVLGCVQEDF